MIKRKGITSPDAMAVGPYSHAVETGDFVYASGQAGLVKSTGKLIEGGVIEQTQQCFDNLKAVLKATDMDFDNVVKVNVYLTSMSYFAEMNSVYEKQFNQPYPARTTVGVAELPVDAFVEIEMIARR